MKRNTMIFLLIVLVASMVAAGSVAAQTTDADQRGPDRPALPDRARVDVATIVADALGIEADALRDALIEDGATLASVIEANGGDVAAIQQQVVDAIVEARTIDVDEITANVAEMFTTERPAPRDGEFGPRNGVNTLDLVADALGIEADALRDALIEDGATLDTVIAANGGDSAAIQQLIVDAIVEATGQDAETVAERVADHFSSERPAPRDGQRGPGGRGGQGGPNGEGRPAQPPAGGVDA